MIKITNVGNKIWDLEYRTIDILKEYKTQGSVDILFNGEGPCCEHIGLYKLLDYLQFDPTKVTIHTHNLLEKHDRYKIKIYPGQIARLLTGRVKNVNINKSCITKHFSCFIGRNSWVRLWIISQLPKDKTFITFSYNGDEYYRNSVEIDQMFRHDASINDIQTAVNFLADSPYTLENTLPYWPRLFNDYWIKNIMPDGLVDYYNQFFCEIVCETYFSGNTFFPTEKTLRPIILSTPFIIHGPVNFLRNLKKLGYKTFDRWWSEEYDMYGEQLRIYKIQEVIKQISSWSIEKIQTINEEMQPTLKHNRDILLST